MQVQIKREARRRARPAAACRGTCSRRGDRQRAREHAQGGARHPALCWRGVGRNDPCRCRTPAGYRFQRTVTAVSLCKEADRIVPEMTFQLSPSLRVFRVKAGLSLAVSRRVNTPGDSDMRNERSISLPGLLLRAFPSMGALRRPLFLRLRARFCRFRRLRLGRGTAQALRMRRPPGSRTGCSHSDEQGISDVRGAGRSL